MFIHRVHKRKITRLPKSISFNPVDVPLTEVDTVILRLEGLEAMHLVDLNGLKQEDAARVMGVSRKTLWKDLKEARRIVTDALLNGKRIRIKEGNYELIDCPEVK